MKKDIYLNVIVCDEIYKKIRVVLGIKTIQGNKSCVDDLINEACVEYLKKYDDRYFRS